MATLRTLIHASANDDRWLLCHGDDVADVFVFHEPNAPSGGKSERITLAAFLARDAGSHQHQGPPRHDRLAGRLVPSSKRRVC